MPRQAGQRGQLGYLGGAEAQAGQVILGTLAGQAGSARPVRVGASVGVLR